jgi:hypothetical protein
MTNPYDPNFFEMISSTSARNAELILPYIREKLQFKSAVDVGCGIGAWLKTINEIDPECKIFGYDGKWALDSGLLIDSNFFKAVDLSSPVESSLKYDIAISIEVAEHLPSSSAQSFVKSLTALSDVVLFSAAIPRQGGANHVNEQWPDYWKSLFYQEGFKLYDVIRPHFWNNDGIDPCVRQNCFLYSKDSRMSAVFGVSDGFVFPSKCIHPGLFDFTIEKCFWDSTLIDSLTPSRALTISAKVFSKAFQAKFLG